MKTNITTILAGALLAFSGSAGLLAQHNVNSIIIPSGTPPTGISKVDMSATTAHPNGAGSVIFTNARITAAGSTSADIYYVAYGVSNTTGALTLQKADKFPGIGVYYEDEVLLGTNLTSQGTLALGATPLAWNRTVALTSTTPITAMVQAGSSITVKMAFPSVDYSLVVTEKATGRVIYDQPAVGGGLVYHWPVALLRAGAYSIQFIPASGTAFRGTATITHNNSAQTVSLASGGTFKFTLPSDSFSYAKAKVRLVKGQNLKVALTQSSAVDIRIVSPDNTLLTAGSNISSGRAVISADAPVTGDYLVFVCKTQTATSIGGVVTSIGQVTILP